MFTARGRPLLVELRTLLRSPRLMGFEPDLPAQTIGSQTMRSRQSDNKTAPNRVVPVDKPARCTDDVGCALDCRPHRPLLAKHSLADQTAFEGTGAEQALRLDELI